MRIDFNSWREREEYILKLASIHPIIRKHVEGCFPSKAACYKKIQKLVRQKKLRRVGTVMMNDSGRAEDVFCNWTPALNQLRHDLLTTDFALCYPQATFVRGWKHINRKYRADAEMTLDGTLYFFEMDTGSEGYDKVRQRQRAYASVGEAFVLYVTLSERRLKRLIRESEAIKEVGLFTTLERVMAEPGGVIWEDWFGNWAAIGSGSDGDDEQVDVDDDGQVD